VHGIFVPERRAVGLTSVVAKASAGALEHMRVARVTNLSRLLEQLKKGNIWIYGLDAEAPKPYTALDLCGPIALVLGGEGRGLRPGVRDACDDLAHIPHLGKVSSLNVSAAAAVVLYEAVRQRGERLPEQRRFQTGDG
jgi:23S rRNA (guanosine2251-2'-O)-methyltransferase